MCALKITQTYGTKAGRAGDNFQNMGSFTGDNGNQGASVSQSNDETHPDNYLMQVINADEFESGVYHLSAMLSSPASNFIGDTEDQAYVYVKTFAQTGGQEILSEVYAVLGCY